MQGRSILCAATQGVNALRAIDRGIAQSGSAPGLGPGCREFESLYPDHLSCKT